MRIVDFKISNYKSFRSTGLVELGPEFTVVIGRNNAGKTALVEAVGLAMSERPHRSFKTVPRLGDRPRPGSSVELTVRLSRAELLDALEDSQSRRHVLVPFSHSGDVHEAAAVAEREFAAAVREINDVVVRWRGGAGLYQGHPIALLNGLREPVGSVSYFPMVVDQELGRIVRVDNAIYSGGDPDQTYMQALADSIQKRIYTFKAERPAVGRSQFGANPLLARDASNLPEVLGLLHRDPGRLKRLNVALKRVLPDVWQFAVAPSQAQANHQEVSIYPFDPEEFERPDLAVPLSECGTGVSQVLALLYMALYSPRPAVIIIDEPQSFLHPGAIRTLLEVLRKEASHHQYVITTHSPTAVTAASPDKILLVQQRDGESVIRSVDGGDAKELELLLAEVGARFSDVFGADRILWVEGRTEEVCLPRILEHVSDGTLFGTNILAVRRTGDLEGRLGQATVEIYERLSRGGAILPPAVGFLLDREHRTEDESLDLTRRLGSRIQLTSLRMFENYLLDADAIAATMNGIDRFASTPYRSGDVLAWFESHGWSKDFFAPLKVPQERSSEIWLRQVHGKKVLSALFAEWSEKRVQYDPVRHGLLLTERLLAMRPSTFSPLIDIVLRMLAPTRSAPEA